MFGNATAYQKNGISAVATDTTGLYATGSHGEPGFGLSNPAPSYAFVKKFDLDGREVWSQHLGNLSSIRVDTVTLGSDGLYISGIHWSNNTVFVGKYDFNGNRVWMRDFGSILTISPWGISVGTSALYVAGLARGYGSNTPVPLIMRSYDLNGNVGWTESLSNETVFGSVLVFAFSNSVYLAGSDAAPSTPTIVDTHAFIAHYDTSGVQLWNRQFDNPPSFQCACVPYGLSGDSSGIYVGGNTYDRSLPGETPFSYGGGSFLRKYDWNGNTVWTTGEAGSGIGTISASQPGIYLFGGGLARYDGSNGNRVWSVPIQGKVTGFAVGGGRVYTGGSVDTSEGIKALLVAYDQSASLVLGGVNPPYSFIIVGSIIGSIPLGILLARWRFMKRGSRASKVSINRYDSKERTSRAVKILPGPKNMIRRIRLHVHLYKTKLRIIFVRSHSVAFVTPRQESYSGRQKAIRNLLLAGPACGQCGNILDGYEGPTICPVESRSVSSCVLILDTAGCVSMWRGVFSLVLLVVFPSL
jgi:hypothetical protein